jgi:hypothetical protein
MLIASGFLLFITSLAIAYQDFKTRMISVWLIVLFGILNLLLYLLSNSWYQLLENGIFCFTYFLFSYLVIHLFYFIKTKRFGKLLDHKIGWGDVLLILLTGICLEPVSLIYFFTFTFLVSIVIYTFFLKTNKRIPLAGVLVVCYIVYLFSWFI